MVDAARAAAAFEQFAIVSPDTDKASPFRWVIWDNGFGSEKSVDLVLFRRQGGRAIRLWSRRWPDGYLPRLQRVWTWELDSRPVMALTFQYGAGWMHLELFGLNKRGQVVAIGAADGSTVDLRFGETGWFFRARQAIDEPPRCLRYHPNPPRLDEIPCEADR